MTKQFPRVGERFLDRYEITQILGSGGMSRVYGAVQDGLDRKVAIKLLAPAGAENLTNSQLDNIAARFDREAKLISSFRSSHTVVMYDYGRSADYLYMILEHVDGVNLHQLVEESGPLSAARVTRIMRQALVSLAEAHEMGILHRDIKPQNIMVYEHLGDPDNTKVLDFGIAKAIGETGRDARKLTEERTIVGTPSYMSPEQILGHQLTPGSDIYSLGLVAYEMLFGIVAVEADSAVSTMARHLAPAPIEIPDDRQMPEPFLDVLRKMIAKDVAQRYRSAAEVLTDLNAWDGGERNLTLPRITSPGHRHDTLDTPPPAPHPTEEADSTKPLVVTGALLVVAILVAVGVVVGLVWMMSSRDVESAQIAEPAVAEVANEPAELPLAQVAKTQAEDSPAEPPPAAVAEPVVETTPDDSPPPSAPEPRRTKRPTPPADAATAARPPAEAPPSDPPEPPEPLVTEPPPPDPAPEPAPAEVVKSQTAPPVVAPPKPEPQPAAKPQPEPDPDAEAEEEKKAAKKKKKKAAPPLSF